MSSTTTALATQDLIFPLGDLPLQSGALLPQARLSYRVIGDLNTDRSNLVLLPSFYGAWPEDLLWWIGPILDPRRWCVVVVSLLGNGRSSSPSHGGLPLPAGGGPWPVDHSDNLAAQIRLLEEVFRVERPALIVGWSMGAQLAYHWAVLEPDRPQRLCCLCGTARTTDHNRLFLLSLRRALTADPAWDGERFHGEPLAGLRHFALIYASWAASQPFYRRGGHRDLGYASVEAYVEQAWLPLYRRHDPHDLLAMLDVWLANDVARALAGWPGAGAAGRLQPEPDADDPDRILSQALGRIRARTAVIAGRHDLYFPPDDLSWEAARIPGARMSVLESDLGHRAGNPRDAPREQAAIRAVIEALCVDAATPP